MNLETLIINAFSTDPLLLKSPVLLEKKQFLGPVLDKHNKTKTAKCLNK